jgi:elongation factor G
VQGSRTLGGRMVVVTAKAPLSELTEYQSRLNAMAGGDGHYSIELSHYDPVPPNQQDKLAAQYRRQEEASGR